MSKAALCPLERMCGKDILKQIESYIKLPWFYYFKVEWQFHFYLCLVFLKIVYAKPCSSLYMLTCSFRIKSDHNVENKQNNYL